MQRESAGGRWGAGWVDERMHGWMIGWVDERRGEERVLGVGCWVLGVEQMAGYGSRVTRYEAPAGHPARSQQGERVPRNPLRARVSGRDRGYLFVAKRVAAVRSLLTLAPQ